jgi:hypothetical protein
MLVNRYNSGVGEGVPLSPSKERLKLDSNDLRRKDDPKSNIGFIRRVLALFVLGQKHEVPPSNGDKR